MFSAILAIMLLPVVDLGRSKGLQFRPLSKIAFYIFVANFLVLMQLGAKHVESPFIEFGQISTVLYFSYFILIVPVLSIIENTLIDINLKSDIYIDLNTYKDLESDLSTFIHLNFNRKNGLIVLKDEYKK